MCSYRGMNQDRFTREFIRRLDAGEFDGRVTEVAGKLTREQLLSVHALLLERERHPNGIFSTCWPDAAIIRL
jgi:hypothetical protein